jgi:hypothetical protein
MQVGTTLPRQHGWSLGAQGHKARSQWQGLALQLGLQFQSTCLPAPPGHAQSKCPGGCHILSRRRTVLPARTT